MNKVLQIITSQQQRSEPSKMVGKEGIQSEEFSEELSDGEERNEIIGKQLKQRKPERSSSK